MRSIKEIADEARAHVEQAEKFAVPVNVFTLAALQVEFMQSLVATVHEAGGDPAAAPTVEQHLEQPLPPIEPLQPTKPEPAEAA